MVGVLACPGFVDSASRASSSISVGVPADFFVISFVVSCVVDMGLVRSFAPQWFAVEWQCCTR